MAGNRKNNNNVMKIQNNNNYKNIKASRKKQRTRPIAVMVSEVTLVSRKRDRSRSTLACHSHSAYGLFLSRECHLNDRRSQGIGL